jgi:hypothetical protein
MDFIVGLPNTSRHHDSIWVIMDRLTKVAHFLPVHTTDKAQKNAELYIDQIVCLHGLPRTIVVGTCSPVEVDPTGECSNANRVFARDGNSSVNLASQGHSARVFIGV